ncbi:MAG: J domain-containing protein [Methanosphaera stadtmanae]|nr:J domain-containing protein [Methanosphaera stadtmanae]
MVKYIRDYYKILDVSINANEDEIKKAYKKAVLKYHPDVNKEDNSNKKFQLIQEAYVVLSDDIKRQNYDKLISSAKTNLPKKISKSNLTTVNRKKKSNPLDTISKGVELAVNFENETGILSKTLNTIIGSNASHPFRKTGGLSGMNHGRHSKRRHRRRGRR